MKEYDVYIFDLDGTLLSTLEDLAISTNYALEKCSMPVRSIDEVRRFVGNGVRKLIERAVPGAETNPRFDEVLSTFKNHYIHHSYDHTAPYPHIIDTLKSLRLRNKRVAVVSNKFYNATVDLCQHFFGDVVEVAIGEREGIRKKPAPDTVEEAWRQLGVGKDNAVYIGDSEVDVETACNSGMPCVSVLWGFRDRDFLESHGAETFINDPKELLDW